MSTLETVEWDSCLVDPHRDPELERKARRALGAVPHALRYLAACPWLVDSFIRTVTTPFQLVHVDAELHDLIWLAVSQDNSCRYCYASQRAMMRILGFPSDRIRRLEESFFSAELDPRERLAIEFSKRISRANPMPAKADAQELLDAGYSWDAVKEVAYAATHTVAANRIATLPAIPPGPVEQMPDRWAIRLARPILAWMIRRHQPRRLEIEPSEPSDADPFSHLVRALGELPVARGLHVSLCESWASPLLSRRAKAFVFAVVARGLGCSLCEREACRLLGEQGLECETIEQVISHLASPALDPVEAEIVPFARETIWCRPLEIQRRGRRLLSKLSAAQFLARGRRGHREHGLPSQRRHRSKLMDPAWVAAALAACLAAALLRLALRARREASRLRARLESASQDLQRLQVAFSLFAPEDVVDRIASSGVPTRGERKEVTALFVDLVGFTALSEAVEPSTLVRILNGYFQLTSRAIIEHRGHVSTFIGDGVLALFGAHQPNPWQGDDAVHAALAMREALARYNQELAAEGLPELSVGVGIHRGVGVAGVVGSDHLKEFAVVGSVVNLASRVQQLTRAHDVDVLVTEDVQKTLDSRFDLRRLPPSELKGVAEPVVTFAVRGFAAQERPAS